MVTLIRFLSGPVLWLLLILGSLLEWLLLPPAKVVGCVFRYFAPVLLPTRSVFLLLVAYTLGLTMSDQGRELVLSLQVTTADSVAASRILAIVNWAVLVAALFWTALQAWWWSRILLDHSINLKSNPGLHMQDSDGRVVWTPRIYAFVIYAAPAAATLFISDGDSHWPTALAMLALGLVMFLFLTQRRKIGRKWHNSLIAQILAPPVEDNPKQRNIAGHDVPITFGRFTKPGLIMLALSFSVALAMFLLERFCPAPINNFLGSLSLALIGLSSIIPVLAIFTIGETLSRAPVMITLAILAFVLSLCPFLDHHGIRTLKEEPMAPQPFATLEQAYDQWQMANADYPGDVPIILVYTAGGGIRAAYWTAALLSALDAADPNFHRRVFAISGVSGGSVGAAFWTAALPNQDETAPCRVPSDKSRSQLTALKKDHLASTLGALLYADLPHAFIPLGSLDRAVALETSWEQAFDAATESNCLVESFDDLWRHVAQHEWRPILLINGTHQETGRRIITSPLKITDGDFPHSLDFFAMFGRDIRVSTAALNSARFTYVSPAGRITTPKGKEMGHILDGGYFENYGARTTRDLMEALDAIEAKKIAEPASQMQSKRPVVLIEIVNDTDLNFDDAARETLSTNYDEVPGPGWYGQGLINEIVAPVDGLLATRGARGVLEAKLSARNYETLLSGNETKEKPGRVEHVQLRLCPVDPKPPLGWVLGNSSVKTMDDLISGAAQKSTGCTDVSKRLTEVLNELKLGGQ